MIWNKVETNAHIDAVLAAFGRFHDSCLREVHIWTEHYVDEDLSMAAPPHLDTRLRFLFQRQARHPSAIELLFEHVVALHLEPPPENYNSIVFDAALLLHGDTFYFADDSHWTPDGKGRVPRMCVAAKALSWRDASDWMGSQLRYGPGRIIGGK